MRCPYCGNEETTVKDTRICENGAAIKRRRVCDNCNARFMTIERILKKEIYVIKADGTRNLLDIDKIQNSISHCAGKRITQEEIERITKEIYNKIEATTTTSDIKTSIIGEMVMDALKNLDEVAYVRFASVYRQFKDLESFKKLLEDM